MTINYVEEKRSSLEEAIGNTNDVEADTIWALLKYKEIGIFRKVACVCNLLGLNFNKVIKDLPQDEKGRLLDYKTRHLIHDALIKSS
jgi:hypothetical protein